LRLLNQTPLINFIKERHVQSWSCMDYKIITMLLLWIHHKNNLKYTDIFLYIYSVICKLSWFCTDCQCLSWSWVLDNVYYNNNSIMHAGHVMGWACMSLSWERLYRTRTDEKLSASWSSCTV
jgi:hypothetical protein